MPTTPASASLIASSVFFRLTSAPPYSMLYSITLSCIGLPAATAFSLPFPPAHDASSTVAMPIAAARVNHLVDLSLPFAARST